MSVIRPLKRTQKGTHMQLSQWFSQQLRTSTEGFLWGSVTLQWAVTKTYQHTLEHTNEILNMYLWWK